MIPRFPIRPTPPGTEGDEDDAVINDAEDSSEASHWSEDYEQNDPYIGAAMPDFDGVTFDSFFGGFESLTFGSYPLHHDMSQITSGSQILSPSAMVLEPRAYELRQLLLNASSRLAMEYPDNPQLPLLSTNIELLTHVEIDQCLESYFTNYHRHCPILHRPSFQPTLAPAPLLLACIALGAMYSDPVKVSWMKGLMDVIEVYIFSLPAVRDEFFVTDGYRNLPDEDAVNYHFQVYQGAYLFVVALYFSGNLAGRRRARRQRYCTVVNASQPLHCTK